MNNCNEIKDLILTDYTDGRLEDSSKAQVEAHLKQCSQCESFASEVRMQLVVPFEKTARQEVPSYLWQQIQQKIENEQNTKESLWESLKGWLEGISFPKLVPALASIAIAFFLGTNFLLNEQVKQAQDQEQGVYLNAMLVAAMSSTQGGSNDPGTPIEKYFL